MNGAVWPLTGSGVGSGGFVARLVALVEDGVLDRSTVDVFGAVVWCEGAGFGLVEVGTRVNGAGDAREQ